MLKKIYMELVLIRKEIQAISSSLEQNSEIKIDGNKLAESITESFSHLQSQLSSSSLVKAIERYSLELQKDADWRKPQNGSTFFNSGYVDYLDGNYVPDKKQVADRNKNAFNNFQQREYDYADLEKQLLNAKG